jgi:hypothetical protein
MVLQLRSLIKIAFEMKQSGNSVNCITVCYRPTENNLKNDTVKYIWKDTYFKNDWNRYTGTYKIELGGGFKTKWYAKIAQLFGVLPKIKVYNKDNYLYLKENSMGTKYINDLQLFEYLPGLFLLAMVRLWILEKKI